jgi:hypothetical protein
MDGRTTAGSALTPGDAWAGHRRQIRRAAMPPRLFVEPNRPSGHGVTICTSLCNGHSSIAPRAAWIGRRDLAERLARPLKGPPSGTKRRGRRLREIDGGAPTGTSSLEVLPALNHAQRRQSNPVRTRGRKNRCQHRAVAEAGCASNTNRHLRNFLETLLTAPGRRPLPNGHATVVSRALTTAPDRVSTLC